MLKWLLVSGAAVGLIDPYLLYLISEKWGFWAAFWVWLAPILVASPLTVRARRQLALPPQDPSALSARLAEIFLIPAANAALWYPGPITSVLGLLLLVGPARRAIARMLVGRIGGSLGGSMQFGGANASVFIGGIPGMGPSTAPQPGGLKRADGRVVEEDEASSPELPESAGSDDNSEKPRE